MPLPDDIPSDDSRPRTPPSRHKPAGFEKLSRGRSLSQAAQPTSGPVASGEPDRLAALDPRRASSRRPKIHSLELTLLWVVATHLVFLPWALGTMHLWAQTISLILSTASFVISLLPRHYTAEQAGGGGAFRLLPWPKLLRFPIFWLGLALLGLVAIHGLNPAWEYQTDGKSFWMKRIPAITWLPAGVRVPFAEWGPWRMLMIYGSAFMTVCAIWVGFTRRRTLQRLLIALAANGVALAILGLAQRALNAPKIFWSITSSNASFFASFIYKNHGAFFLNLTLAVTCGLGLWYYRRGARRMEKSNPSGVFAFFATTLAISIIVSYARGATLGMLGYLALVVVGFVYYQFRLTRESRTPLIAISLVAIFAVFLMVGLNALHSEIAWDRLESVFSGKDVSVEARIVANQASLEMLGQHWGMGVGAGSFQFLFPSYQLHFPAIWNLDGHRVFWEQAHNDVLQFPIEFGVPGMLLIFAGFVYWGIVLVRAYAWQNPLSASVVLGCLAVLAMAWGDFVFRCPAVLITWLVLWTAASRWSILEEVR